MNKKDYFEIKVGGGKVSTVLIGTKHKLAFIGGPCAIENESHTLFMAENLNNICTQIEIPFIFKSCYDKDCRSSPDSFLGIGIDSGLKILEKVRLEIGIPVTSDVSNVQWVKDTADVVDLIQIPAYLCRQTHLLSACGRTGKPINIKKGQFIDPKNMRNSLAKIFRTNNKKVILTERGTFFGYNMLVNDFRGLKIMNEFGVPVCYDATHSIQRPTGSGSISQGQREFIPGLVRAAVAMGINALFMEVHDNPDRALSDPATQLNIKYLKKILLQAMKIHELRNALVREFGEDNIV